MIEEDKDCEGVGEGAGELVEEEVLWDWQY